MYKLKCLIIIIPLNSLLASIINLIKSIINLITIKSISVLFDLHMFLLKPLPSLPSPLFIIFFEILTDLSYMFISLKYVISLCFQIPQK